jgi:hypothetical protein
MKISPASLYPAISIGMTSSFELRCFAQWACHETLTILHLLIGAASICARPDEQSGHRSRREGDTEGPVSKRERCQILRLSSAHSMYCEILVYEVPLWVPLSATLEFL